MDELNAIDRRERNREKRRQSKETARRVRELLAARFPACFRTHGSRDKVPLKIGIKADIKEAVPELSYGEIYLALKDYCGGPTYLRSLIPGAARIDLSGHPAGSVTDMEFRDAINKLVMLETKWGAYRRGANDNDPESAA